MNKIKKIFALSALAVCLAGMVFAFGSSAGSESKPEIISKNVMYTDKFILMYAVDAETVVGNEATLRVYEEYPTETSTPICTLKDTTAETITKADGTTHECYVFITNGIAATEFTTNYYVTVTDGAGHVSDVARYSVAEYLNERLYKNGIAAITEGDDAVRKDFYLSTLAFGANAENVLFNLDDDKENDRVDLVTDYKYIYTDLGTIDGEFSSGVYAPATELDVVYTGSDTTVKGWTVENLENGEKEFLAKGTKLVLESNCYLNPNNTGTVFNFGNGVYYNDTNVTSAKRYDYTSSMISVSGQMSRLIDEGIFKAVKNTDPATGNAYASEATVYGADNGIADSVYTAMTNPALIFETDIKIDGFNNSKLDNIMVRFNGLGKQNRFYLTTDGEKVTLSGTNLSLENGEWYNLRFEFYKVSDSGDNGTYATKIYVNNVYVGTKTPTTEAGTSPSFRFRLYMTSNVTSAESTFYLDNTFYGYVDKAYVAGQ
ncbi:MAG: hypothetical protein J6B48_03875 [Clostridia bacterium]|nr:hypothetical protein [Clostridia bacterium]